MEIRSCPIKALYQLLYTNQKAFRDAIRNGRYIPEDKE